MLTPLARHRLRGPDRPTGLASDLALSTRWAAEDRARRALMAATGAVAAIVGVAAWLATHDPVVVIVAEQVLLLTAGLLDLRLNSTPLSLSESEVEHP